eukprot:6060638-Alexandrium_andersonii.AAC.1
MSASLVGSEMCIRDRGAVQEAALPGAILLKGPGAEWEVVESGPNCDRPVSYTHLTLPTICSV